MLLRLPVIFKGVLISYSSLFLATLTVYAILSGDFWGSTFQNVLCTRLLCASVSLSCQQTAFSDLITTTAWRAIVFLKHTSLNYALINWDALVSCHGVTSGIWYLCSYFLAPLVHLERISQQAMWATRSTGQFLGTITKRHK